jgi:hypothetical protein
MAIEIESASDDERNAGAIATTSLTPGETADAKWAFLQDGLSRFAGRSLELDEEVYRSEAVTNFRNRGIAKLLEGYGRMYFDALEATDIYTKQCSFSVTVKDLAVMGATLADGGVNPVSGERVIDAAHCKRVQSEPRGQKLGGELALDAVAGLVERRREGAQPAFSRRNRDDPATLTPLLPGRPISYSQSPDNS